MFYFFTYEANPVPLVFDYNIETNELVISVVKLSELSLLIDSEEDVATVEEILKTAKDNIETYSSLTAKEELDFIENPEDNFYIDFMIAISEVIEDFSGRKKIDLLVKYNVNEFDSSIDEDVPDLNNIPINKIDTEDLFKTVFEQERELIQLNKKLEVLNDIKEEIEDIKKWWIMEDSEKEELKAEIWKDIKK